MSSSKPPPELEEKLKEYKALETELQGLFSKKQQILSQLNENTLVQGELGMITEENPKIYKLVGPALIPVEFEEAKDNVSKRLKFIEEEIKKIEVQIDTKQGKLNEYGNEVQKIQQKMQEEAAIAARAIVSDVTS